MEYFLHTKLYVSYVVLKTGNFYIIKEEGNQTKVQRKRLPGPHLSQILQEQELSYSDRVRSGNCLLGSDKSQA